MENKGIDLTDEEKELKDKIEGNLKHLKKEFAGILDHEKHCERRDENAKLCLKLHKSLKSREHPPVHCKYVLENRRVSTSESLEFYQHVHPQEDLIKFIKDKSANIRKNNRPDVTMGETFKFNIYSQRWGHDDCYKLTRNANGWYIEYASIKGYCDFEGNPYLYQNFNQDFISYPEDVGSYLSSVWQGVK